MSGFSLFLNDLIEWSELKRIPLKAIIELNEYRNFYVRWLCDVAGLECVLLNIKQRWYHPLYNSISPNKILGNIFYQLIAVRISWIFTAIFWMKCDSTDHWFFFLRMAVVIFEKTELFLSASTNEVREMDNDVFDMLAFVCVCVCVCVGVWVCVSIFLCSDGRWFFVISYWWLLSSRRTFTLLVDYSWKIRLHLIGFDFAHTKLDNSRILNKW